MSRVPERATDVCDGFLAGDPDAVRIVRGWVAAAVYRAGWNLSDPEAAVQEIQVRLIEAARDGRIRPGAGFHSLVRTVARHHCTDVFRRERLRGRTEEPDPASEERPSRGGDPYDKLERRERLDMLRFVFQALPAECRRLWRWVYADGLAAAEVAARLGISAVNARVRLHRCLEKARAIHEQYVLPAAAGRASEGP